MTYSDVQRRMYGASIMYRIGRLRGGNLLLTLAAERGSLQAGVIRDSDYLLSDGTESRRSSAEVTGNAANAANIAIGWELRKPVGPLDGLTVLMGLTRQGETIRMQNGVQVLPGSDTGGERPLTGLDSRYEPRWTSPWIAFQPTLAVGWIHLHAYTELDFASRYRAKGRWNLREELAQPVSFEQEAGGWAARASLSASWQVVSHVAVFATAELARLVASDGTDITHLASGGQTRLTLRRVSWSARRIRVGFSAALGPLI